jgi:hypothetical protein
VLPENIPPNALFGGFFYLRRETVNSENKVLGYKNCKISDLEAHRCLSYSEYTEYYCTKCDPNACHVFTLWDFSPREVKFAIVHNTHVELLELVEATEEPKQVVTAGPSYSEQVLADAKAEAAKLADDWDLPLPNDDF